MKNIVLVIFVATLAGVGFYFVKSDGGIILSVKNQTPESLLNIYEKDRPSTQIKKSQYFEECGLSIEFPSKPVKMDFDYADFYVSEVVDVAMGVMIFPEDRKQLEYDYIKGEFISSKKKPRAILSEEKLEIPEHEAYQLVLEEKNKNINRMVIVNGYRCFMIISAVARRDLISSDSVLKFFNSVDIDLTSTGSWTNLSASLPNKPLL